MKKLFLYWLIAYLGVGNVFLLQTIKVPDLVVHYQLHFKNNALTIFEFLEQHYNGKETMDDKDRKADNALPFKSSVSGEKPFNSSPPETDQQLFLNIITAEVIFATITGDKVHSFQSEIFQPPRC